MKVKTVRNRNRIEIEFKDEDDLVRLVNVLSPVEPLVGE